MSSGVADPLAALVLDAVPRLMTISGTVDAVEVVLLDGGVEGTLPVLVVAALVVAPEVDDNLGNAGIVG